MRWLRGILGIRRASPPNSEQTDNWLFAGYDRESSGDKSGAEALYRRALEHDPSNAEAHYFLGRLASWDHRRDEAIALFQKAADLCPAEATYWIGLGDALAAALQYEESLQAFQTCLTLLPNCVDVQVNRAVALIELDRREEARGDLERLREKFPEVPQVHFNLAGIYREYARIEEAISAYRRVQELSAARPHAYSNLLLMLHYSIEYGAREIYDEHRRFGDIFSRRYIPPPYDRTWPRRLRIGYISPDFRSHVVTYFIEPVLASHDRSQFEIYCYYTRPDKDVVTERLRGHVEHWVDCEDLDEEALADRIRRDRIDILVDLAGHTGHNSLTLLAMKPAPVQATYLGYPDTTGLGAVDYRLTDAFADPPGESDLFSTERLVRLPKSYFCYRPASRTPDVGPLPVDSAGAITFGCFNNFHKITAPFLDAVARVLEAVPGSRFMLKGRPLSIPHVAGAVRDRFVRAGIDASRIVLRGWEPGFKDHLAIYREVDIALDSFPYNGATTTCEALWMGVPVVAVAGDRHAARVGSSLLNAVGLGRLVARDIDDYVGISAALAHDVPALGDLRRTLRERMRGSALMDERGFTREIERCYLQMWNGAIGAGGAGMGDGNSVTPGKDDGMLLDRARKDRAAGRLADAQAASEAILLRKPDHAEALQLLWDVGFDGNRPGIATSALLKAIAVNGNVALFHHMLGCVLQAQRKIQDAISSFRRALELDPGMAKAHNNVGCLFERAGGLDEAIRCYRKAIAANPELVEALYNLGNAYRRLGDRALAIDYVGRALALEPRHADWQCNLGELHHEEGRFDEAIACYLAARDADPAYELASRNLGIALAQTGRLEEAAQALGRALQINARNPEAEAWLLLLAHYRHGDDAEQLCRLHREWESRYVRALPHMTEHPRLSETLPRRLNVGYLVGDARMPFLSSFIEPVLGCHDAAGFNVTCYASGAREARAASSLRESCAHWRDLSAMSDEDAAYRIRADGIDILVDLSGHHPGGRLHVLGRKPAAIQVSWLGYPGTTGMEVMDYRLTDAVADAGEADDAFYTERLLRLPRGFFCFTPPDSPEPGLPPSTRSRGVTFGCFADLPKLSQETIVLWSEVLRALPTSRLVVANHGLAASGARDFMRERFESHGIAPERLELSADASSTHERMTRYLEIDVALDPFPCNGMRATCEALWMGVPVVTLAGRTFGSRTGASILVHAGVSELVAASVQEYVETASRLALDVDRRRAWRTDLRERLRASPLTDAPGFTRALEAAYLEMWAARSGRGAARSTGTNNE